MKSLLRYLATCVLLLGSGIATAQTVGYETITPPLNTSTDDQVEVVEYFWFGCPHCYTFEPTVEAWEKDTKADYVKFMREAPPLNSAWEQHSRAFYAARFLGHEDAFVHAMFKAIHDERKRMRHPKEIAALAAEVGMDKDKFLKTMQSFAVNTAMQRAVQQAQSAGISGVPAVVINGKYRTGAALAGSNRDMITVIDRMSAIEAESMGLDAQPAAGAATAVDAAGKAADAVSKAVDAATGEGSTRTTDAVETTTSSSN